MSRRKQDKYKTATDDQMKRAIRKSLGHNGWRTSPPARRLKCDRCKKTWKFSDKLNFAPCPKCKEGRLS